jgi:hypothetical protein
MQQPQQHPGQSLSPLGKLALGSRSSLVLTPASATSPLPPVGEDEDAPSLSSVRFADTRNGSVHSHSHSHGHGTASVSGGQGNGQGAPLPVPDPDIAALERELGDIRTRRAQVTARYEARLEYLRAKLKSAEMKERLMRK